MTILTEEIYAHQPGTHPRRSDGLCVICRKLCSDHASAYCSACIRAEDRLRKGIERCKDIDIPVSKVYYAHRERAILKDLLNTLTTHLKNMKDWPEADFVDVGEDEEIVNMAKKLGIPVKFSTGYIGDGYSENQDGYWKIIVPGDL